MKKIVKFYLAERKHALLENPLTFRQKHVIKSFSVDGENSIKAPFQRMDATG